MPRMVLWLAGSDGMQLAGPSKVSVYNLKCVQRQDGRAVEVSDLRERQSVFVR